MGRRPSILTAEEDVFCKLIAVSGLGSIEAARKAFGWRCEPNTKETQRARDLARAKRVKERIKELEATSLKQAEAKEIVVDSDSIDLETLRKFAIKRLKEIRDDERIPAQSRFKAVEALERLADPSKDVNLIWRWINMLSKGAAVHCPCCHKDLPLARIKMPRYKAWLDTAKEEVPEVIEGLFERRNQIIKLADKGNTPHSSQIRALSAPERHIMGMGPARAGKSYLIALFAILYFLVPGTECWILARVFEEARSEKEYLEQFLRSLFYPYDKYMISTRHDAKSGEWTMTSRWGSEIKIKSSKSQGSITGRELDAIFCAEPGWLPDDIYNHVRARLSSRFGRIIALGTPQGLGGFISRIVFAVGRDPKTGKVRRLRKEDRLIENGASWPISALVFKLEAKDNPTFVKAELDAARQEMSDAEYASEFEGEIVSGEGMKFNAVKHYHLRDSHPEEIAKCSWVLGVDQGQKNFGAVLAGYDGTKIHIVKDFFEGEFKTIRTNLIDLRTMVPNWIRALGGDPRNWKLTIFDQDPPLHNTLMEMEQEMMVWPTDVTYRHDNKKKSGMTDDWRKETTVYLNEMAKQGRLWFLNETAQLHDEVMRTENVPGNPDLEGGASIRNKGWKISGSWRQDHVLDGLMFCLWTILSEQLEKSPESYNPSEPYEEQRRAWEYSRRQQEENDLAGFAGQSTGPGRDEERFREVFGRGRKAPRVPQSLVGHYSDY